jgi:hypothetical protein
MLTIDCTIEQTFQHKILHFRWMDRREVLILNSFMEHRMEDSISSNPKNTRKKPATVLLYNKTMGAVDNVDKTTKPYQSVRKSIKWYKKVAFYLIDVAIYNSNVIYGEVNPEKRVTFKNYLQGLVAEILKKYPVTRKPQGRPSTFLNGPPDRLKGQHHPRKHLSKDEKAKPLYSDCLYCKYYRPDHKRKATPFSCKNCNVRLCIQGEPSCFELFHSEKKLGCGVSLFSFLHC